MIHELRLTYIFGCRLVNRRHYTHPESVDEEHISLITNTCLLFTDFDFAFTVQIKCKYIVFGEKVT